MRQIHWAAKAIEDLQAISDLDAATAVDATAQRFALTGHGFVRVIHNPDAPDEHRLYVSGAPYFLRIHFDAKNVYIWRVVHRS